MARSYSHSLEKEVDMLGKALLSTDNRIAELIGNKLYYKIKPTLQGCCRASFQLGYLLAIKNVDKFQDEVEE